MQRNPPLRQTGRQLRLELSARHAEQARGVPHETTVGETPSIVYGFLDERSHGNFLPAAFARIQANQGWAARLQKAYTGVHQLPRAADRRRGELECAASSDALLMNIFCYPGVLRRAATCACMGIEVGSKPCFGVRVGLPMVRDETDRTELDMQLGDLLVEAKLTEGGFGRASFERLRRYKGVDESFALEHLPQRANGQVLGYQIVRGLLAAEQQEGRYAVLLDARRTDLVELCFEVLRAVRRREMQSRFRLITWQELAQTLPKRLQTFLGQRFGIGPG